MLNLQNESDPNILIDIKLEIDSDFNRDINDIDIDAETILFELRNRKLLEEEKHDNVNSTRQNLIKHVQNIQSEVNRALDGVQNTLDHENLGNLRSKLSSKSCFYLSNDILNSFKVEKDTFGLLVETDFYLTSNQINFLR